jgi:hypothetical protein
MKLIADVNFDVSYSFIFSARPGTPAADMVDDVPEEKKQRLYILQERINQQAMPGAAACSAPFSAFWWKAPPARALWSSPVVPKITAW